MTRRTYIYDPDLDAMVEITAGSNSAPLPCSHGMQIIRDIEPYRAAGSDVATENKRPVIGGRRQHREFLARNGYVEVGNERLPPRRESWVEAKRAQADRVADIKRAMNTL